MRPAILVPTIRALIEAREPFILEGMSGVGKTEMIHDQSMEVGEYLDVRLNIHRPEDLSFPLPDIKARAVHWVQSILPNDPKWKGVIVLEELGSCEEELQKPVFQLVLEGRIGTYNLPQGAAVCATTNRMEDAAGVREMLGPLRNRLCWLTADIEPADWIQWAIAHDLDARIIAWHNFTGGRTLHTYTPNIYQKQFATPRSWTQLSRILRHIPAFALKDVVAGKVGEGTAGEFLGYLEIAVHLPDLNKIVNDPAGAEVPDRLDVLYSVASALALLAKNMSKKELNNVVAYALRLPAEAGAVLGRDVFFANKAALDTKAGSDWAGRYADVLFDMKK